MTQNPDPDTCKGVGSSKGYVRGWGGGEGEWIPGQEAPAGADTPHDNSLATREFLPSLTWSFSNGRTIHRAARTVSKDLKPLQGVHQWL